MSVIASAGMTPAGYIITYFFLPMAVIAVPGIVAGIWRANKAAKTRAIALAENGVHITSRMDTQDQALARILEVVSPVGQPSLDAVLARITANQDAHEKRLTEHINAAAVDKALIEQRIANIRNGGSYQ